MNTAYEDIYLDNGFEDDELEVYRDMWKYLQPEYSGSVAAVIPGSTISGAFFSQSSDPASIMNSIASQCDKLINDFYANVK